jgi:hypothetical protein
LLAVTPNALTELSETKLRTNQNLKDLRDYIRPFENLKDYELPAPFYDIRTMQNFQAFIHTIQDRLTILARAGNLVEPCYQTLAKDFSIIRITTDNHIKNLKSFFEQGLYEKGLRIEYARLQSGIFMNSFRNMYLTISNYQSLIR